MKKYYLGIDLGTSSVKGVLRAADGESFKAKRGYSTADTVGWLSAVREIISRLRGSIPHGVIAAVAVTAQVGTYIVNGETVIPWSAPVGAEELAEIRGTVPQEEFEKSISMRHPELVSYPLPRLRYIQKKYGDGLRVDMPKELIIQALTGIRMTDIYSMRGIANLKKGRYADDLIGRLGINADLPALGYPLQKVGEVNDNGAAEFGLDAGTAVYLGCNDFFAGLLGMGVYETGDCFELSGTSEHIGYISEEINRSAFVSGGYFNGYCSYGGTKSSGASCKMAMGLFGVDGPDVPSHIEKAPLFLPYLNGERAPIFDENARGVFFGLSDGTDKAAMAYSVSEGVIFSLYHIAAEMDMPIPKRIICGGGSTQNALMNKLRASLFGCEIIVAEESDSSALGACMLAMVGEGIFRDIPEAIERCVSYRPAVLPEAGLTETLRARFKVYSGLYGDLKESFKAFSNLNKEVKI